MAANFNWLGLTGKSHGDEIQIDYCVLSATVGSASSRNGRDPNLPGLSQAYNYWHPPSFCQYSPNQLKFAAMLPLHDVNLACQELVRCVRELSAVASFIRPNC